MLVLTRKINEAILIGDDIKVTLLNIESDRVRIGIDAPKSMRIYRYETLKKVVLENQMAASANVNIVDLSQQLKEGAENAPSKTAKGKESQPKEQEGNE